MKHNTHKTSLKRKKTTEEFKALLFFKADTLRHYKIKEPRYFNKMFLRHFIMSLVRV